jgi:hypothetical protein
MRTRPLRGAVASLGVAGLAVLLIATAAFEASAQTGFVPYYGKNRVKYDTFNWHIYTTDHFEIYYYPELEDHLERVAGYAESAYQHVSSELKHDLAAKVPLVLFKTHSEFQQQNIIPIELPEGVQAFAEPVRDRMVLPLDEPPDRLYGLIVHELTHIFEFDIIPRSLIRRNVPLWVDEGLADYMRGTWDPSDLMMVRDAAVADIVPRMSEFEEYGGFSNPRLVYNLGHAAFEFIESRWGKEGIRQFLFSLRKSVIGGGENAYEDALGLKPDEFDQEFDKYLKERFRPFRDKERPADYGRNLAPDPRRSNITTLLSIEPSPSGDLIAAAAINRKDRELDIVLLSSRDGQIIRNLTPGFDKNYGWDYLTVPSRWITVPWLSWSPVGDRLAYFVRQDKRRTLILQNVLTRRVERRIPMTQVDEPESPSIAPGGRLVAFSALQNAIGDIFTVDLDTQEVKNLTNDEFFNYAPVFSPDGTYIVYLARVSGNNKLFRLDLASGNKTQLTFGTHDEAGARFLDDRRLIFPSTALDPMQPVDPEVVRNGAIYNLWTLDLKTGELRQYTDALGGNFSPIVLQEDDARVAFVSYFKGEYGLHMMSTEKREPVHTAVSEDFGAPGPIIDFQAPLTHTLIADNQRRKGTFEKLFLEGRPPVNVGVTSGGDVFGGSQITFTDVLGDQQFNLFAASISQYRTLSFSYLNLARRFQYAAQGFTQTLFFYGYQPGLLFDQGLGFLSRDQALATRTVRGGAGFGIYPISRYRRFELSGGIVQYREEFRDPTLELFADQFQREQFGERLFRSGTFVPFGLTYIQETTVFREFGPLAGNTVRIGFEVAPKIGNSLSRQTADVDARYYKRIGTSGLLALRARGFKSWGEFPDFLFFGGNSEMRGFQYLEFVGHNAVFMNAELRFPLIEAMLTPIGILGGVRGTFFFNVGGAGFNTQPLKLYSTRDETVEPLLGFRLGPGGIPEPVFGDPVTVSGFRLHDARASYGIGLQTFALGFPIHFDWAWRTLFNQEWEDLLFRFQGAQQGRSGSDWFRRPRFSVWIGYDF